ncbi:AarF/UbiB family protein [Actinocorallia populi]|uniref:AarF/UbiB family protein n=1 Tax=Actinocorallia populi TaxID=2079200 RepID=UPI000D087BF1|nr:AarF/UbiB family protein [Actinocorallia populi]
MAAETPASALVASARNSAWVSGQPGLASEVERWARARRFRDAALDERARAWASPGPPSLSRLARHALAVPAGQVRWAVRRLPGAMLDGLLYRDPPEELLRTVTAGWLRDHFEALGPSGAEIARLVEQSEGIAPGFLVDRLRKEPLVPPPIPAAEVWRLLDRAFPGQVLEVADEPFTVSLLSQLHPATLSDGRRVLFRVARPGVRGDLMRDLRLAATLLGPAELVPRLRAVQPLSVLRSTARQAIEHTDLRNDALNSVELGLLLEERPAGGLTILRPVPEFAAKQAVAFEFPEGAVPLAEGLGRAAAKAAVPGLLTLVVEGALADGVFHADLRPEHLLVLPDGSLALAGCSAVGRLDRRLRLAFLDYITALFGGDFAGQADALARLGAVPGAPDPAALAALEEDLRSAPELAPLRLMRHGEEAGPVLREIAVRHGLRLPSQLLQWMRALLTYRALTRHLVPDMPFVQALLPLLPRLAEINRRLRQDTVV